MSTAIPSPAPEAAPAAPAREIRQPLLWLLAIVAVGLVLRGMQLRKDFQVEEFTALAAVAERQGVPAADAPGVALAYTPTADNPLVAVASPAEVSRRSVIPFGIQDPVPVYHYVLWGVAKVLPVTQWSLRLPSLLAGLGCIVAVYFLCRRLFGTEMALVAALFVALEPIQIATGWLARPYALANLAVVLSFAALAGLLSARKPAVGALLALGYAACLAVIGYMNAILLCVVAAHVGMVAYALWQGGAGAGWKAGLAALGLALGVGLLAPEFAYWGQVYGFAREHKDYLAEINRLRILTVVWHNLTFFAGLLLVLAAGAVVRMQLQGGGAEEKPEGEAAAAGPGGAGEAVGGGAAVTAAPAAAPAVAAAKPALESQPLPENEEALWMSRFWLFLPQMLVVVLAFVLAQSIFSTRFLTYTTLGAAILLAYYATRDASREVRLGVAGVVALALLLFGFSERWSLGDSTLYSCHYGRSVVGSLTSEGMQKVWRDGDVVLVRSGLPEADFLRTDIPEATRPEVERAILAPLTTLYPDVAPRPVMALPFSEYHSDKVRSAGGDKLKPEDYKAFYNESFVARVKGFKRYRMTGLVATGLDQPNWPPYLAGFLPRLAVLLDKDLQLSRNRGESGDKEHYVIITRDQINPAADIDGLTKDVQAKDFDSAVHLVQEKEKRLDQEKDKKPEQEKK
jgi:hypothetical protein